MAKLQRKTHFLGAKIRRLRKSNGLTLEDLSMRCVQLDAADAPSVSYLSLIETGRRVPSERVVGVLARAFQRDTSFFLDDTPAEPAPDDPTAAVPIALEPAFLFGRDQLETAIPELLSQTGTTGRQFAHVLIRAYQERKQNRFPDLERAAEEVGGKRFPLGVEGLMGLLKRHGLKVRWFRRDPFVTRHDAGHEVRSLFRSFYEAPSTIYMNRALQHEPSRLKYDLACHLAHKVLHGGDGMLAEHATGGELGGSPRPLAEATSTLNQQDVLQAWREFECSFFAGALLCPKQPFRHFLVRHGYDVFCGKGIELTPAVVMRRMTAVSSYPHWHYLDAYPPGYLRAVYRADGIPVPWGNMRMVTDPCRQWGSFRALAHSRRTRPWPQISLLHDEGRVGLYSDVSLRTKDAAGNPHAICVGIDLVPALENQGTAARELVERVAERCEGKGETPIDEESGEALLAVANILNIGWIADALDSPVNVICPRSTACPRARPCDNASPPSRRVSWVHELRAEIRKKPGR